MLQTVQTFLRGTPRANRKEPNRFVGHLVSGAQRVADFSFTSLSLYRMQRFIIVILLHVPCIIIIIIIIIIIFFFFFFFFNRLCSPCGFWPAQLSLRILSRKVFTECRCQRHVKPPTWRTYYFVWPTNAQLFHKLSHSYLFRQYRVIVRKLVINTLPIWCFSDRAS